MVTRKPSLINAINFTAKGELALNKGIELNINLGGDKSLIIPAGNYNINLAADLDPTQLIGIDFTNLKGASVDKILEVVSQVLNNVVYKLKIEISDKNSDKKLLLDIYREDESIMLALDTSLLSGTLMAEFGVIIDMFAENPLALGTLINVIKDLPFLKPSADSKTEADNNAELIATIGRVIKNMSIVANAGKLTVDLKNFSVAENKEYGEDGETVVKDNGDTTLDAKVEADKNGLTVDAAIKNMILDGKASSITAKITANSNGVTLTAKSEEKLNVLGGIDVDLVLKLTEFKYGA